MDRPTRRSAEVHRGTSAVAAEALQRVLGYQQGGSVSPDETVQFVEFSYDSPSPIVLQQVSSGQLLDRAAVLVTTAFDDPAAEIDVGTSRDPDAIFGSGDIDLSVLGQYENRILLLFSQNDLLLLTIDPASSTRGAGILLFKIATR